MANPVLLSQLRWFTRLRWLAGGAVAAMGLVDWLWLGWYGRGMPIFLSGIAIIAYNAAMVWVMLGETSRRQSRLVVMAWAQILLDLSFLTLLLTWTGGFSSPLGGLYVLHMIFASLLLTRRSAYAAVGAAVLVTGGGLFLGGNWPSDTQHWRLAAGWAITLVLTVYVSNRIIRALRRQRRRLLKQNRDIRRLARQVRAHQKTLVQQEKMAAVGQMAAGITHEIANPLASMDSLLQVLQRKPERISAQSLDTLRQQIGRINQIVRQMATLAHPGEGSFELVGVNEVVDGAMEILRLDKRMAGVKLQTILDPSAGRARLIPQAMNQVIVNLVANALDAVAQTAEPKLTISTRQADAKCEIRVTDNGHGIRPEHMSRIFEPFFTTKPVGKGTGVGLSITYSLVRKQNCEIDVSSRVGEGTTFIVMVPTVNVSGITQDSQK